MNLTEAVNLACKEETLLAALTFICTWETERVVEQARENKQWDTCFNICLGRVMQKYVHVLILESRCDFWNDPLGKNITLNPTRNMTLDLESTKNITSEGSAALNPTTEPSQSENQHE